MKGCSRCKNSLPVAEFRQDKKYADGLSCWCRGCQKQYRAEHYQANKGRVAAQNAEWHKAHKAERNRRAKERYAADPQTHGARVAKAKARRPEHYREAARERMRVRRKLEPCVLLRARISAQLRYCLGTGKGGRAYQELVGYSVLELRRHLERQFVEGMGWENMGAWHIDHIVPLSSFQISGPDCPNLKRAWALTNLRPLWAAENIQKRDKAVFLI